MEGKAEEALCCVVLGGWSAAAIAGYLRVGELIRVGCVAKHTRSHFLSCCDHIRMPLLRCGDGAATKKAAVCALFARFSARTIQRVDLSWRWNADNAVIAAIVGNCPRLLEIDLTGCRYYGAALIACDADLIDCLYSC